MPGMKSKAIKSVLARKFEDFLASVDNTTVREAIRDNTIITGGAIASMLLGEPVNDFDMYFRNWTTAKAVAEDFVARFSSAREKGIPCAIYVDSGDGNVRIVVKSAGVADEDGAGKPYEYFEARPEGEATEYVGEVMADAGEIEDVAEETWAEVVAQPPEPGKPRYRPVFLSTNAITLSERVQLVLRFFGEPDTIHENYDFVHCTNYWTSWDRKLVLRQPALESLLSRELFYSGSRFPICSLIRLRKFIRRGWRINAGQILKMAMQISELDLSDPVVLRDQLTGVDAAYFAEIMRLVKEGSPEKVNSAYLCEIVDRLF